MTAYIIQHIPTGKIEPSHSNRHGIWATRATALQRIKSHWHVKWDWDAERTPGEDWQARTQRYNNTNDAFRTANPFDQWWPKYYKIKELVEKEETVCVRCAHSLSEHQCPSPGRCCTGGHLARHMNPSVFAVCHCKDCKCTGFMDDKG